MSALENAKYTLEEYEEHKESPFAVHQEGIQAGIHSR